MVNERQSASETVGRVFERVLAQAGAGGRPVEEVVNETLYRERERLKKAHGERAEADRAFYAKVRHELPRVPESGRNRLLHDIVERYATEIQGRFDPRVYAVATRVIPVALSGLMTGLSPKRVLGDPGLLLSLDDRLVIEGETDALRRLEGAGTAVLVPTHCSNLDSVLMGHSVFRMGLPPVVYGAGLNLFSNPLIGFFMRNLGAYTVDRLKTDPLYRETLKEYATVALEAGQHSLFFPGGTRSRSGGVERRLKKGLLGTALSAYRNNLRRRRPDARIFVFPCTLTYPLVLEAETLVSDYLAEAGKSRFIIVDDEFSRVRRWLDFLRGLVELDLRIHLRIGRPLDPFGNEVDADGRSLDPRGRPVDPARYLLADGEIVDDPVRDGEYTQALAGRIVESFSRENVAVPTSVVAFVAFELLRRAHPGADLYRLLRTVGPETSLSLADVELEVERVQARLRKLDSEGRIRANGSVSGDDAPGLVRRALRTFATYHPEPVLERRGVRLHTNDAQLLFFYRNRLEGYGLMDAPDLLAHRRDA